MVYFQRMFYYVCCDVMLKAGMWLKLAVHTMLAFFFKINICWAFRLVSVLHNIFTILVVNTKTTYIIIITNSAPGSRMLLSKKIESS